MTNSRPEAGAKLEGPEPDGLLLNRRHFMTGAGGLAALGLAGLTGLVSGRGRSSADALGTTQARTTTRAPTTMARATTETPAAASGNDVYSFVTRPDLRPPVVKVTTYVKGWEDASPGFIFLSPKPALGTTPSQSGLMIVDRHGRLVFFKPIAPAVPFDFNVQPYKGQPALTWWQGKVEAGTGHGDDQIANNHYQTTKTVKGGGGLQADLHEFVITPSGTALITAYEATTANLSSLGGPTKGPVLASHAQVIDLATGKLLFDWNSLSHVGLAESYAALPTGSAKGAPYDYFHINSVQEMQDGNLLISGRNTWALYSVDLSTGNVVWRMNGKKSDFTMGPGSNFYWQHDARMHAGGMLTVFDDGSSPPEEKQSRALSLFVDTKAKHVSLNKAYLHPAAFLAASQGSVQVLADGRVFVGWGNQPYFSEYAPDGALLMDGELPLDVQSYRAFTYDWTAKPSEPISVVVRPNPAGGSLVYVSWNGATQVQKWTVLAGKAASSLVPVGSQAWGDFETAIAVNSTGPMFSVVALDAKGKELSRSGAVNISPA